MSIPPIYAGKQIIPARWKSLRHSTQGLYPIPFSWGKGLWLLYPKSSYQWARLAYALLLQWVIWLLFFYRFQNADQKKVSMLFTKRTYHNGVLPWAARALQHNWDSLWEGPSSSVLEWGETKNPVRTLEGTLESGDIQLGLSISPGWNNWDIAHWHENWSGISKRDGPFIPGTSIPRFQPSSSNFRASRSMTFELRWCKTWKARTLTPTHQARAFTRSSRTHQSGSTRPVLGWTSYNNQIFQVAEKCQVKAEPQNDPHILPALSEKEKAELVGKCYLCKELGHMARNCPQGNRVKSNTGKPPGTSNFNIEFNNEVDILESLPLGMMEVKKQNIGNNWQADYPDWNQLGAWKRPEIRNCWQSTSWPFNSPTQGMNNIALSNHRTSALIFPEALESTMRSLTN